MWIIDSGASNHITFNKNSLTNIKTLPYPILISLPNGYKVKVIEFGDVSITPDIILHEVLYVPSFKYNLVSVHSLTTSLKCTVLFTGALCVLQAPSVKRPQAIGNNKDGLYFLCSSCLRNTNRVNASSIRCCHSSRSNNNSSFSVHSREYNSSVTKSCHANNCREFATNGHGPHIVHSPLVCTSTFNNNENIQFDNHSCKFAKNNVDLLWHNRLGHVPFAKMRNISTLPTILSQKQPFICTICPMARQERLPFSQSTSQTKSIFELLHIDLWGPYHVSTYDNYKYFLTLVDDYSRSTWTHLLSTKSNALHVLKAFIHMVENQFKTTVKCIRSDNGLEFTSNEATQFFINKGIIHQKSCPYTPQQNSVVERKHKYLLETARALLFQSKLPLKYWGECVLTATHIINRLPSTHSKMNKCPYELLYNQKPNYAQLRSFGCLCYPTVPKTLRDKLEPRTTPHIFVGYPFGTKGYKVMSHATEKNTCFQRCGFS